MFLRLWIVGQKQGEHLIQPGKNLINFMLIFTEGNFKENRENSLLIQNLLSITNLPTKAKHIILVIK